MQTSCVTRRKNTDNIGSKTVAVTVASKVINQDVLIVCLINQDFYNKYLIKT